VPFLIFLVYIALVYVYPGEVFPALAAYRITYWVGISGLVFAAMWLAFKRSSPLATVQFWFLLAFTCIVVISRMLGERWFGAVIPAMNSFGPSLAMFLLCVAAVDTIPKMRATAICIGLLSVALAAQGIAAYHFGYKTNMFLFDPITKAEYSVSAETVGQDQAEEVSPESISDTRDQPDELEYSAAYLMKRIRGLGLLHDPNDLALGLVMALPLVWAGWRQRAIARNLLLVLVPSGLLLYGLYLTRSRGGALAFLVTICVASSRKIGRIPSILLFVVLMSGGVAANLATGRALTLSDESVSGRIDAWSEGLQMLKSQPLLGVGYGLFNDHHDLTAHNSLVLCFAETGLIGYFFWFGLIVITFVQLHGLKNLPGTEPIDAQLRHWASTLQLSLIGFMTAAMFLSRTFIPMLYLLIGMALALTLIARHAERPVWLPSVPRLGSFVLASEVASIVLIYIVVRLRLI